MQLDLTPPDDLAALNRLSTRIGADPLLIQAAGGNTSIKTAGVMWIKASGTRLADALTHPVMVTVDLERMRRAIAKGDPAADRPAEFQVEPGGLRPSIETSLHAVFAQRVVVHVHCVETIALAVRTDARLALAERLAGFDWGFVDYFRPGAQLAAAVRDVLRPGTDVVVLGNHGLIVAADTAGLADALLGRVVACLRADAGPDRVPDLAAVADAPGYRPADDLETHQMALDPLAVARAGSGVLYPDHVVFCGPGVTVLATGETVAAAVARVAAQGLPPPMVIIAPGRGVLLPEAATAGTRAMARCLADVLRRVPPGATLQRLSADDVAALMDWDAEKYRQALNAG